MNTFFELFKITGSLDLEIMRFIYVASLVISLLVYQRYSVPPIGIVIPGTIMLLLGYPDKILIVLAVSMIVYIASLGLYTYVFPKTIFSSREKLLILVSLSLTFTLLLYLFFQVHLDVLSFGAFGITLPALLADKMNKKHKVQALKSLIWATGITFVVYIVVKLGALYLFDEASTSLMHIRPHAESLSTLSLYFVFGVTVVYSGLLYRYLRFKPVGLLLGAYLGLMVFYPVQLFYTLIVLGITWVVVSWMEKRMLLFGYRTFVLCSLIAAIAYSCIEIVLSLYASHIFSFSWDISIAGILLCGMLVSEMLQNGTKRVVVENGFLAGMVAVTVLDVYVVNMWLGNQFLFGELFK